MSLTTYEWTPGQAHTPAAPVAQTTNFTSPRTTPKITPITAVELTLRAGDIVSKAETLHHDAHQTHGDTLRLELDVRTQQHAKTAPTSLLSDLGSMGFAWRDVARALGVSVPALQKWRRGEGLSGESRLKLARFVAAIDVVAAQLVDDIASWFETPLSPDAAISPLDLWADGEQILVLRYASNRLTGEQTLDEWDADWRAKWHSDFTASRGEDGHLSISRKG